jgi:hypothetical protein
MKHPAQWVILNKRSIGGWTRNTPNQLGSDKIIKMSVIQRQT